MWTPIRRLFGTSPQPAGSRAPVSPRVPRRPRETPAPVDTQTPLSPEFVEFLEQLIAPPASVSMETLTPHDIMFLEGLIRRLQQDKLQVAMLPQVTLRLTEMLRRVDVPVANLVALISEDTSLSVEILKAANSAFYSGARRISNLNEAVMRIGLTRVQAIVMMALLKGRVLKAGALRGPAELLVDMSLPLGSLAAAVARATGGAVDLCFMRGMLLHVEHLLVLGTVSDTSRECRVAITPSTSGILLTLDRCGAEVRYAAAFAWNLEEILIRGDNDEDTLNYVALRHALINRWLGRPLPAIDGIDPQVLEEALAPIGPRVSGKPRDGAQV
jgi:HD-like signal output (HDOD) protein